MLRIYHYLTCDFHQLGMRYSRLWRECNSRFSCIDCCRRRRWLRRQLGIFSGAVGRVDKELRGADLVYERKRDEVFGTSGYEDLPDHGPIALFPIRFIRNVNFWSRIAEDLDVVITYLTLVPTDILCKLNRYYFGWVEIATEAPPRRQHLSSLAVLGTG
jgi:hypothetical protein